jgi:hypothetical protein
MCVIGYWGWGRNQRHQIVSDSSAYDCRISDGRPRYPQANLARLGSSIPYLAPRPLNGDAGGIAYLEPNAARTGLVGAVDPLRHDALGAKPARMSEHSQPIFDNVFVEQDAGNEFYQQRGSALAGSNPSPRISNASS